MTTDTAVAAAPAAAQRPEPGPMDLILALGRRLPSWWPLALCLLLGTLAGLGYGAMKTPNYTATSYVVVNPERGAETATALGFAHAYGRVVSNAAVLADAQAATGIPANELRNRVQAVTSPEAPMIEIVGSDVRADKAATNANEVARALTAYANASAASTGVRLSVLSKAPTPTAPASPSIWIAGAVGACAGGLLGCLILLVKPSGRRGSASVVPAPAPSKAGQPAREATR
ncbi:Wzz/FepE/Etk N-terminal domain-containing protein [Streptomyces sp. NPDC051776]|uniref:Wzz/FepE/Etk N-terminal domain-containing protein n=1 Tax=Streptomyces sp. NPDC051776 TaxID=3155414 RepID=UPI0034268686